jgi:hypothetical protein
MSREQVANGLRARLRRGDVPRQPWHPGPGHHGGDHAIRPDDDAERRVVDERLQGGALPVAGEADAGPSGLCVPAGLCLVPSPGWPGDLEQQKVVPAAEVRQGRLRLPRGQHRRASRQDRVQPDGWAVTGRYQRVGDQAAGP